MNKTNKPKSLGGAQAGHPPSLAKELGDLISLIEEKKYITNKILERLREWENIMSQLLEKEWVEIVFEGKTIGFRPFDDWAGTTKYTKYLFHIEWENIPSTREEIGKTYCNFTNRLSRKWKMMTYNTLKFFIRNISMITKQLLIQYADLFPGVYDNQKLEKVINILKEVK